MSALLTDLYQLTMMQAYLERGMDEAAVFELFVRKLPPQRNFLLAAGLEQVLEFLETMTFSEAEIAWLEGQGGFSPRLLDHLRGFRFTGDVDAMPEGTPFFADEPVLRVTAPLTQAQLVESRLLNIVHLQTLIASKAARIVISGRGRGIKQVWRRYDEDGRLACDRFGLASEPPDGEPLLQPFMRGGRRLASAPTLDQAREHCKAQLERLPAAFRSLDPVPAPYPVEISERLRALAREVDAAIA